MAALPPDYDTDPQRWQSLDRSWLLQGDAHEVVAERLIAERVSNVLDLGCGHGRLRELLPSPITWVGLDASVAQLTACPYPPRVRGDATRLPFADDTFDSVAALWVLYHLDDPEAAIAEARRVLRSGGWFAACSSARNSDPELCDGYAPTTFDAEEAPDIVGSVFGSDDLDVQRWDGPFAVLPDHDAVTQFLRSHHLPSGAARRVTPPVQLTKRGCLVFARKP
jgi:SAM-dependent methyltransferase